MATYTAKILKTCPTGEHLVVAVYQDGKEFAKVETTRSALLSSKPDILAALPLLLRESVASAKVETAVDVKAAVEAKAWVL